MKTAWGRWAIREGWVIRVEGVDAAVGFGEVAPLPQFGTEDLAAAEGCLLELAERLGSRKIDRNVGLKGLLGCDYPGLVSDFPAVAFGLASAVGMLTEGGKATPQVQDCPWRVAGLLPAGQAAVETARALDWEGRRSLKWKMGVLPVAEELVILKSLLAEIPPAVKLRLDANGGLREEDLKHWLNFLVEHGAQRVEYLEQPLMPGEERRMQEIAEPFGWAGSIALDESICRGGGERFLNPDDWPGPVVIKPSLLGNPERWTPYLKHRPAETVTVSSAFETDIGVAAAVAAVEQACGGGLADAGIDTVNAFDDGLNTPTKGATWQIDRSVVERCGMIWDRLGAE